MGVLFFVKDKNVVNTEEYIMNVILKNGDQISLEENSTAYAAALANEIGLTSQEDINKIKACFEEVKEYDSRITEDNAPDEWEAYNKYEWSVASQSFKTVEEGAFLILADYWESELASSQRATAYKVVIVESEADVIKGENDWRRRDKLA